MLSCRSGASPYSACHPSRQHFLACNTRLNIVQEDPAHRLLPRYRIGNLQLKRSTDRNRMERSMVGIAYYIGRSRARTAVRVGTFDQVICSPMRIELIATIQDSWIGSWACNRAKPLRYCGAGSDDAGRLAASASPHTGLAS